MKRSVVLIAAVAVAIMSGMAVAEQAQDDVPKVTVQIGDLDLRNDAGVKVLYQRIVAAADQVCVGDERNLSQLSKIRQCKETAIDRAVLSINNVKLARLHAKSSYGRNTKAS